MLQFTGSLPWDCSAGEVREGVQAFSGQKDLLHAAKVQRGEPLSQVNKYKLLSLIKPFLGGLELKPEPKLTSHNSTTGDGNFRFFDVVMSKPTDYILNWLGL